MIYARSQKGSSHSPGNDVTLSSSRRTGPWAKKWFTLYIVSSCRVGSHLCDPGSIPVLSVLSGLSLLLVLYMLRGFSPGPPVFLPPKNQQLLNSNSIDTSKSPRLGGLDAITDLAGEYFSCT